MREPGHEEEEASVVVETTVPGVVEARLHRPRTRNAVNRDVVSRLLKAVSLQPRVLIIGSAYPSAFCSGADVTMPNQERAEVSDLLYELYERIVSSPSIVVVAMSGPAVGAGAQLALAADLRVAGPNATIRFVGPGFGLAVGGWGLPSLVGRGVAVDLCLSGRTVGSEEAQAIGLVDRLDRDPVGWAREWGTSVLDLEPGAVVRLKRVVLASSALVDALRQERRENRAAWSGSLADP